MTRKNRLAMTMLSAVLFAHLIYFVLNFQLLIYVILNLIQHLDFLLITQRQASASQILVCSSQITITNIFVNLLPIHLLPLAHHRFFLILSFPYMLATHTSLLLFPLIYSFTNLFAIGQLPSANGYLITISQLLHPR